MSIRRAALSTGARRSPLPPRLQWWTDPHLVGGGTTRGGAQVGGTTSPAATALVVPARGQSSSQSQLAKRAPGSGHCTYRMRSG